jgi:hypothetical protein
MYIHEYIPIHAQENHMTISSLPKHLIPSLVMASAAFVGSTTGAGAGDLRSDPQEQARQLLAPTNPGRPVALAGSSSVPSGVAQSVLDPQELARRLLVGAHGSENTTNAAPAVSTVRLDRYTSPRDGQALAQWMILGVRGTAKTHAATTAMAHSRDVE